MRETRCDIREERVAVATDNVPNGALNQNENGSINIYDEAEKRVGVISADEAETVEKSVTDIIAEE